MKFPFQIIRLTLSLFDRVKIRQLGYITEKIMKLENCSINWDKVVALITVHFAFCSFLSQPLLFLCGCDMLISWKKGQILTNVYSPLGTLGNTNNPSTPDLTRHKGVSMSVFFLMFSITSLGISSQPGKFFKLTRSETRSLKYYYVVAQKILGFNVIFLCV